MQRLLLCLLLGLFQLLAASQQTHGKPDQQTSVDTELAHSIPYHFPGFFPGHASRFQGSPPNTTFRTCKRYPGSVCKASLCDGELCQSVRWDQESENNMTVYFRGLVALKSADCRASLQDLACGIMFPSCKEGQLMEFDQYPCQYTCDIVSKQCDGTESLVPQSPEQLIGRITDYFNVQNCSNFTTTHCTNNSGATGNVKCPTPLGDPNADGFDPIPEAPYCGMPCESPVFDHDQYHVAEILLEVLAWSSLLLTAVHLVERITSGEAGKYPQRMQLHFAFCVMMVSAALCINTFVGEGFGKHPQWCQSQNETICLAQAMLINYFALAVIMWWVSVCVHLYLALAVYHSKHTEGDAQDTPQLLPANHNAAPNEMSTLEKIQRDTAQWEVHFKMLSYAVPGAITVVLAMCNELGAGGIGQIFCWIKDDNKQLWQFAFFYVELGMCFTVGITLFGMSLRYVWTRDAERSMAKIWSIFISMREGILFVVLFFLLFFWMLVYRIQIKAQYDEFGDAYSDWIECTLIRWADSANFTSTFDDNSWERCPNRDTPSYTMWISEVFCIAGMGVLEFLVLDLHHCVRRLKNWCWPEDPMEMIDERLLEGSTDTIPKLDALEEHAAVMNVDHATLGNSQGSSVPWLDTLSLLPNGTGTADSPHMGRSNLSSEPTATMNSDSNNSTPCPSPQISGQNPNISYVATQDALRMSMRQHRKSMTLKHTAPSHLSKREIYALAMAPSAITSDSLPSPIAEEVPTFSQPGAPSTTQGQAQDMHISETLQASQPGQNPSVQGALEAAPRQQSIATAAQTMAAVAQTAASIAQTTNPLPRSSTTFGRSNASQ